MLPHYYVSSNNNMTPVIVLVSPLLRGLLRGLLLTYDKYYPSSFLKKHTTAATAAVPTPASTRRPLANELAISH
jgi:hypothetical protein